MNSLFKAGCLFFLLTLFFLSLQLPGNEAFSVNYNSSASEKTKKDTVRKIIISEIIYTQLNKELTSSKKETPAYEPLKSINVGDTLTFDFFMQLLDYFPDSKLNKVADSLFSRSSNPKEDSVVISRAHLSAINRQLKEKYSNYKFYHELNNAKENDTIPFRYIKYLMDFEDYKEEIALREQIIEEFRYEETKQKTPETETEIEESAEEKQKKTETVAPGIQEKNEKPDEVIFRVQIAASRVPLDEKKLQQIYAGNKRIVKNYGDGWHRYSIGLCQAYEHATRLKKSIDVEGAFEVAYKGNQRLNAYRIKNQYKQCPKINITNTLPKNPALIFKVQIAASRNKLSPTKLSQIYCGDRIVYESSEEQWYKYSVGNFRNYADASGLRDIICTPGAFVVAYKNGKKTSIQNTMKDFNR